MKPIIALGLTICAVTIGACSVKETQPSLKARNAVGVREVLISSVSVPLDQPQMILEIYRLNGTNFDLPTLIMFASLGREASDFNELATRLNQSGYPIVLVEAPLIGASVSSTETPTLFDLALDVQPVMAQLDRPAIIVGHAFGNRLARTVATQYPEQTGGVILLAAGGKRPIAPNARTALLNSFNPDLPTAERKAFVRYGFFSGDNDIPDHWMRGWHQKTAELQINATSTTPAEDWWAGGTEPMLVITGLQDTIAPPEDTIDLLKAEFPDRVTAVRIDGAGHALLPEAPDEIANAVLTWLDTLSKQDTN